MLLNIQWARHHSDDLIAKLPQRKLAPLQPLWLCRSLLGARPAHHRASFYENRPCLSTSANARSVIPARNGRIPWHRFLTKPVILRWNKPLQRILHFRVRQRYEGLNENLGRPVVEEDKILQRHKGQGNHDSADAHLSCRRRKKRRIPPSKVLNQALRDTQNETSQTTQWSNKLDYSFQSPLSPTTTRQAAYNRFVSSDSTQELSLQKILASYFTEVTEAPNGDYYPRMLAKVFDSESVACLNSKGYDETDVVLWHWILSATSSERAALRLNFAWIIAAQRIVSEKPPIPVFVFLHLLRRKHISLHALFHLLLHAWQRLGGITPTYPFAFPTERFPVLARLRQGGENHLGPESLSLTANSNGNMYNMTEPSIMIMVVRLARHARKVWPASLQSIVTLFTKYINGHVHAPESFDKSVTSRLSKLYNKALSLVALPSSQNPYAQIGHHQQAQFIILRAMDAHKPPLVVNREGYRGVARVQLAHRKTCSEQNWADLKSDSWPPWKEDKLGFDAEKGVESGLSRAGHAMRKMHEAGYSMQEWEQTAQIYTGWDTDWSPTIQTRKIIPGTFPPSKSPLHVGSSAQSEKDEAIQNSGWAARVRATRTLDEAWACFLNYNRLRRGTDQQVYLAMFEKLFFDYKRCQDEEREVPKPITSSIYPGDGLEVYRKPTYANSAIYVPTPPPTIDAFLTLAKDHGAQPAGRLLAFLLGHSYSFQFGRKVYDYSYKSSPVIRSFLYRRGNDAIPAVAGAMKEWPGYLQAAFLRFVGKFMTPRRPRTSHAQATYNANGKYNFDSDRDLGLALLLKVKPHYLPAWYSVISTLASGPRPNHHGDGEIHLLDSLRVLEMVHRLQEIGLEPDMQGIQLMCVALEASLWAQDSSLTYSRGQDRQSGLCGDMDSEELQIARIIADANQASRALLVYIKEAFQRCISMSNLGTIFQHSPTSTSFSMLETHGDVNSLTRLPRISDMPPAATLHAFVRVLGLSRDYEGILQLAKWITQHAPTLQLANSERSRSTYMLKRVVIAIRVFLERAWEHETDKFGPYDSPEEESTGLERPLQEPELYDMSYKPDRLGGTVCQSVGEDGVSQMENGTEDLVQQAIDFLSSIDYDWGGWPTDDEIEDYFRKGRNF